MWRRPAGLLQVSWFFEKSFSFWKKTKTNKTAINLSCGGFSDELQCWKQTQACWALAVEDLALLYSGLGAALDPEGHRGMKNKIKRWYFGFAPASWSCVLAWGHVSYRKTSFWGLKTLEPLSIPAASRTLSVHRSDQPAGLGFFTAHKILGSTQPAGKSPALNNLCAKLLFWGALWDVQVGLCMSFTGSNFQILHERFL